ncbi:PIN domain-containing protein [Ampullimonas aquatilis]|uniref:PIN domain-containing protein n=1 Tax=Ampullimonas aquatilis TaxID=1341549 RepID=UPI003C7410D5
MPNLPAIGLLLDSNVLLDIVHFADPDALPIRAAIEAGRMQMVSNAACRDELIRVLAYTRFKIADATPHLTWFDQHVQLFELATGLAQVRLPRCSDEDDQKFLECARDTAPHFNKLFLFSKDKAVLKMKGRMLRDFGVSVLPPRDWFLVERHAATLTNPEITHPSSQVD